ncbi:MAG: glycosyltransferase family 4 protein [Schwartzia sp.]|nr:glycosyltransferase family 4 protein [Schwartzia sp. (in: firmicutes)]
MEQKKRRGVYSLPAYAGWSNQQLTKNCGIVPYLFYKKFGFHAVMAGAKTEESYPYMKYVEGMDVEFLPDGEISTKLDYINSHAEEMDLFVLHGFYPDYEGIVSHYRKLRPDGKVYLELDLNLQAADRMNWRSPLVESLFAACDVIGASCRSMQRYMSRRCSYKIEYIPNGFYDFEGTDFTPDFSKKENIILNVGRLGTYQKNTELLMEAFADVAAELPEWTVRLVGNMESGFQNYIETYFAKYPDLRDRVIFVGLVSDRNQMAEEYKRAKIFALTSRMEGGTPNVIAEALSAGNYIVTSEIDAAEEAVDGGHCGEIFPMEDKAQLANILRGLARDNGKIERGGRRAVEYAKNAFDFGRIVDRLYYLLYGECGV